MRAWPAVLEEPVVSAETEVPALRDPPLYQLCSIARADRAEVETAALAARAGTRARAELEAPPPRSRFLSNRSLLALRSPWWRRGGMVATPGDRDPADPAVPGVPREVPEDGAAAPADGGVRASPEDRE